MQRQILSAPIRDYLKKDEIVLAIIRASTDLQQLLTEMLFFKKGVKFSLIENWGLGQLIQWNAILELTNKDKEPLLKLFSQLRNIVFHRRAFIEKILKNTKDSQVVRNIVLSICDFIDSTEITYSYSQELENEYAELLKKIEEKYENFLSDYYKQFSKPEGKDDLQ